MMHIGQSLYLDSSNNNQEDHDTQHQLGRKTKGRMRRALTEDHHSRIDNIFADAAKNGWMVVVIIDDFTKTHTNGRPLKDKASEAVSMCTIVVKIIKNLQAIRPPKNIYDVHHHDGLHIKSYTQAITPSA